MMDKRLILGTCHFVVAAVLLKLLGLILPCCITFYYSFVAHFLLYVYVAKFTFEITKKWFLNERLQPENRAVFITGCDSGFGHQLAKRLDSSGYPVFAGCLFPYGEGAEELRRSCSNRLQIVEIDVTKDDSVKYALEFVKENLGISELWAVVNNAGIMKGFDVELSDMETFKGVFEVNVFGPVRVTKAFLPLLRQSRGRVVNVTSRGGRIAVGFTTPYAMSKHAAVAFTECLKQEMEVWGVRVISVEPESFKTGLTDPEAMKKDAERIFSKLHPDLKEDYGEEYFKAFINFFISSGSSGCSEKIHLVVDALEDAISLQYPNSVYKPCRNVLFQMLCYFAERLPILQAIVSNSFTRKMMGLPKPKAVENYSLGY